MTDQVQILMHTKLNQPRLPYNSRCRGSLALIHQIQWENAEARRMVELISQYDLEQSGSEDEWTCSLRARLTLLQGDLEGVC